MKEVYTASEKFSIPSGHIIAVAMRPGWRGTMNASIEVMGSGSGSSVKRVPNRRCTYWGLESHYWEPQEIHNILGYKLYKDRYIIFYRKNGHHSVVDVLIKRPGEQDWPIGKLYDYERFIKKFNFEKNFEL